ncbi:MAG: hypothetical protein ABIP17_01380, partial [Ilumatobacteraceae bacterium]
ISAVGVGASVAASFGGLAGIALSIAVSIGRNEIDNRIEASIEGVTDGVTTRAAGAGAPGGTGDIVVRATSDASITAIAVAASVAVSGAASSVAVSVSGAGAAATNVILTQTHAFISGSRITTATGNVEVTASDSSRIRAVIVAASAAVAIGFVGVGASIGVSLATNLIGWKTTSLEQPAQVHASVSSSIVEAGGELTVSASSTAEIEALVLAISVAIAGGAAGIAATGAGSSADNRISTDVRAFVQGGPVTATVPASLEVGTLRITARDLSRIRAAVAAASVGVAGAAGVGASVSIAVSLASNRVSNDVSAYLKAITLDKVGVVLIIASSGLDPPPVANSGLDTTLEAAVIEGADGNDDSAATPEVEVVDSGAVADLKAALPALNLSDRLAVSRLIEGEEWILRDLTTGIGYRIVKLEDGKYEVSRITIDAVAVAASVSVGIGGVAGVAASGAGALAVNTVLSRTNAYIQDSTVRGSAGVTAGDVTVSALSTSSIIATIVSVSVAVGGGAFGGGALSIGVALARNKIGVEDGSSVPPTHRVSDSDGGTLVSVMSGQTVLVDGGPNTGKVYQYLGTPTVPIDLLTARYDDTRLWRDITTRRPVQVQAYILRSDIDTAGKVELTASSRQSIASLVIAGSAAVSGSGGVGVSGSGAGASSQNVIATEVRAYIEGAAAPGVRAASIELTARDASTITADVGAGSLAGAIGLGAGVAVSIAIALAENEISNVVEAYVLESTLLARSGAITVTASEEATITAITASASVAVGGGFAGVSVSGAGAGASNLIRNAVRATAANSSLTAQGTTGDVVLTATDTATITAIVVAASVAVAGGAIAVGVSIGVSIARNRIGLDYDYASDEFVDPFTGTDAGALVFGGDLVRVAPGHGGSGLGGRVYRYLGPFNTSRPIKLSDKVYLSTENYGDAARWMLMPLASGASVEATLTNSGVDAGGVLKLIASAEQQIRAVTVAASAALVGGLVGVGASGAGSSSTNVSAAIVKAGIFGAAAGNVSAKSIEISAMNTASITSVTIAASVAISIAPIGAAVAVAVAISRNVISNTVSAEITVGTGRTVKATSGPISVRSVSTSQRLVLADGTTPLDLATKSVSSILLDTAGALTAAGTDLSPSTVTTLRNALAGVAPLRGDVTVHIIEAGQRWQVISEEGDSYVIEKSGSNLYARRSSISGYTLAAAIAGGLGAVSASGASSTNLYTTSTVATIGGAGTVESTGRVDVSASDTASVTAFLPSVSVSIGAIAAAVSAAVTRNVIKSVVDASLGDVTLRPCTGATDNSCEATVQASSVLLVHASTLAVAVAVGLGGATSVSYARSYIGGETTARTGATKVEGPKAKLALSASATIDATAVMKTGAGGAVAVSVSDGRVKIDNLTRAFVGQGADIDVRELAVKAARTSRATGSMNAGAGALVTVTTGGAITEITGTVESYVGPGSASTAGAGTTTIRASGAIDLLSQTSSISRSTGGGGSGGGITISAFTLESKTLDTTRSFVGDGVTVARAGSLRVKAEVLGTRAETSLESASGGAITIQAVNATSRVKPVVEAWIGDAVIVGDLTIPSNPIGVTGDVEVTALGRAEADAVGNVYGGAAVAIGVPQATIEVDPTVDAHIGTAGATTPTRIYTAGSVRVRAELTTEGAVVPSDAITAFDITGETITFSYPGIGTGSSVLFSSPAAVGTLRSGSVYTVLDTGIEGEIRLGSSFDVSAVDPLTETITFSGGHPYQSGDCVYYAPNSSGSIIAPWQGQIEATTVANHGCTNSTTSQVDRVFYVRRIDDNTIKLTTTYADAVSTNPTPYTVTADGTTQLQLSEADYVALVAAGMVVGTPIVYEANISSGTPRISSIGFANSFVDVGLSFMQINDQQLADQLGIPVGTFTYLPTSNCGGANGCHVDNDEIFVGPRVWQALMNGQALRYRNLDGSDIGLTDGTVYYVVKGSANAGTIKLAASYCSAVGTQGDGARCPADLGDPNDPDDDMPVLVSTIQLTFPLRSGTGGIATPGRIGFEVPNAVFANPDVGSAIVIDGVTYTVVAGKNFRRLHLVDAFSNPLVVDDRFDVHAGKLVNDTLQINGVTYTLQSVTGVASFELDRPYGGLISTQNATWTLRNETGRHLLDASFAGLSSGRTYYVMSLDDTNHTIELTAQRNGSSAIVIDGTDRGGFHKIGRVLLDLDLAGVNGIHTLTASLGETPITATSHRLLAPSGDSLSSILPPPGDGRSSATAQGGQGGLGEFTFPTATAKGSPSVAATLAAGRIEAGGNIELHSVSVFDVTSSTDTAGGGAISVGKAISSTDLGDSYTTATVAAGSYLSAAGDLIVEAENDHTLSATARSVGGGAIAGKIAYTHLGIDNDVIVDIGANTTLLAGGALRLLTDSATSATTKSETYSVALGAGADSDNTNGGTRGVRIGQGGYMPSFGTVAASGNTLTRTGSGGWADYGFRVGETVNVTQGSTGRGSFAIVALAGNVMTLSRTSAWGSETDFILTDPSERTVRVGGGAQITGRTVDIDARVSKLDLYATAWATAYSPIFFGVASAFADAMIGINSLTQVQISNGGAGTRITGIQGVDIQARHEAPGGAELNIVRNVYVLAVALIFPQEGHLRGTDALVNVVDVDRGVLVVAGARLATPAGGLKASPSGLHVALYVEAHNGPVNYPEVRPGITYDSDTDVRTGHVWWDADVIVLGGLFGAPFLVVDSDGIVRAVNAVQVIDSSGLPAVTPTVGQPVPLDAFGGITVADIINTGYADILMEADTSIDNQEYTTVAGNPNGEWPTFEFRDTLDSVTILDASNKALRIGGINVVNDLAGGNPLVQLRSAASGVSIEFDLRRGAAPSYVDVEKRGTGNLGLTKVINNPIGLTRVIAYDGSIVVAAPAALVVTNQLDIAALAPTGSIGGVSMAGVADTTRLHVDLVQFLERFRVDGPSVDTLRPARILAEAGRDVRLSLRGVDRTGALTQKLTVSAVGSNYSLTRTAGGSWTSLGEGFIVGDLVRVFDSSKIDRGLFTVTAVSSSVLTVAPVGGATLAVTEATLYVVRTAAMNIGIDRIDAGRDVDLELRDTVRQPGTDETGDVDAQVPNEIGFWATRRSHSFHFRGVGRTGSLARSVYDPARTGVQGERDPAVYSAGIDVSIDGTVTLEQRHEQLARVDEIFLGTTQSRVRLEIINRARVVYSTTAMPAGSAGVIAGDDIIIADTQGLGGSPTNPSGTVGTSVPRINVAGFTDVLGLGHVDVNVDGSVELEEVDGDLRVGMIRSRASDVTLRSRNGSITDAPTGSNAAATTGDVYADVVAINVTLHAASGTIGSNSNFLEIDSSNRDGASFDGLLNADALGNIRITETIGTLRVDLVDAAQGDVSLVTLSGSIVDGRNDAVVNVSANSIDLDANGGSIGDPNGTNDLEIDSARQAYGDVGMEADDSIFVTEVDGTLHLVLAEALGGSVRITVRESADLDEHLDLLHDGSVRFVENVLSIVPRGRIAALNGSVLLRIGDDMTSTPNSEVRAGTTIDIYGDWNDDAADGDAGYGTTIVLRGDIVSGGLTSVFGNADTDTFQFGDTTGVAGGTAVDDPGYINLGGKTRVYGTAIATPIGGTAPVCTTLTATPFCDEDTFTVYFLQSMDVAADDTLTLDGQSATDDYFVYTSGSRGSSRNYIVNVLDTGTPGDGVDTLDIYGADSSLIGYMSPNTPYPTDDIFLLRRTTGITDEVADRPAFVALLHTTLDVAAPTGVATTSSFDIERINYDTAINGRLSVSGRGGNDYFASDDNSAITTLDGGAGNDTFQIGQIYGLKRDGTDYTGPNPNTSGNTNGGSLAPDDVFGTVATTRGWLSAGNTQALVAQGGIGDDLFVVYSNQAALRLEGDDGNDQFIVRAFALALTEGDCNGVNGVDDPFCQIVWRDAAAQVAMPRLTNGFSTAAETDIRTGAGNNQVEYNVNAPVSIEGGNGIDKVVVLGTEFADHIVVTAKAIYGAGLTVTYATIEILEIDGLEGDDTFDILSTAPGVATRVIGGLGSDIINVAGDVAGNVVSREIEGTSGTINHGVSSNDPLYDGLLVNGIDVTVARPNQGQVVIEETGGFTDVREGGNEDSYIVYLAEAPTADVYVTVSVALSSGYEFAAGGDTLVVSGVPVDYDRKIIVDGVEVPVPKRAIVLRFTATSWSKVDAQTVWLRAVDDGLAEGDRVVTVSHSVISADSGFDHAIVRNVEVTIRDNDQPSIQVVQVGPDGSPDNTTVVVEGTTTTGLTDAFDVRLSTDPQSTATIELRPIDDRIELTGPAGSFEEITPRSVGTPGVYRVTLTGGSSGTWQTGVRVTVHAINDFVRQDPHYTTIAITAFSGYVGALPAIVDALIIDDDTAGVVTIESGGRTLVSAGDTTTGPGPGDDYAIRLTQEPTDDVRVALVTDGQTDIVIGGRVQLAAIGGQVALPQFTGDFTIVGDTLTRVNDSALGSFSDEGFAVGQLIRLPNSLGVFTITALTEATLTLSGTPGAGSLTGASVSRLVTRGLFTGSVSYDAATGTLTRSDGSSWLDDGFLEGQLFKVDGFGDLLFKIQTISGTTGDRLDILTVTSKLALPSTGAGRLTFTQWAAVVDFDGTNWYELVKILVQADPWFELAPGRENLRSFAKRAHLLSGIRGPVAVEGGPTATDRSLRPAVMLPGETNAPLFQIAEQPDEAQQVDVLNIFDDSSREDRSGTMTSTALTGFGMGGDVDFSDLLGPGETMPFGEPSAYPGGISYGSIVWDPVNEVFLATDTVRSTIEVLNLLLGEGNDTLTIESTLVPGPDGTGQVAVHGGITVVHGGGNSLLEVRGDFTVDPDGTSISRNDGVSWADAGFAVGQQVMIDGMVVGTVTVLDGGTMTVSGGTWGSGPYTGRIVAVLDPKTERERIGGDLIIVTGGAGPDSPLIVYGDTSQDGIWYSGDPIKQSIRDFGTKPFPGEVGNGTSNFFFPIATPYTYAGHDVIDASALFAGLADNALPTVGFTAYGGIGDDTIIGSQAADYLVGGSGDDVIHGGRGSDQIYGDNGVNVDVITRELVFPFRNSSVRAMRDSLTVGEDVLYGDVPGGTANTTNTYDDVIFGDYGVVTQDVESAIVGSGAGPTGGYVRAGVLPERIENASRIREITTVRPEDGADDEIHGDGGRDRILGGNGDDVISGDGESDVIFGDHGRMVYISGAADVTTLHLVESISFPQGGIDTITAHDGDDIIAGGVEGDIIDAGEGQNIVFGDHGRVTGVEGALPFNRPIPSTFPGYTPDDYQVSNLALVEGFAPDGEHGSDDTITTGLGRDMIFGGAGGDRIVANSGENLAGGLLDGNNIVIGDYGFVDYMVNLDPHDIDLIASFDAWTNLGGADVIFTGARNDIVIGGTGADVLTVGEGFNLAFGDNARLASDPTLEDTHETVYSVHEFRVCSIETIGFDDDDGGGDTIYGSERGDFIFGGAGSDVIYGKGGNDIIFGDQGKIACRNGKTLIPDHVLNGVCVNLGGLIDFYTLNNLATTGSGDDLIFAGTGNDIVLGQQGNDILYGEGDDDILIGGSNIAGAIDNWVGIDGDVIDGGSGNDLIAGDNADACFRPLGDHLDPRMRALAGT